MSSTQQTASRTRAIMALIVVNAMWGTSFPLMKTINLEVYQHFGVNDADVAFYDTVALQRSDSSQARRRRQANRFGEFGIGHACIVLNEMQNPIVDPVKGCFWHKISRKVIFIVNYASTKVLFGIFGSRLSGNSLILRRY